MNGMNILTKQLRGRNATTLSFSQLEDQHGNRLTPGSLLFSAALQQTLARQGSSSGLVQI
jgi:hypothetical protein